MARSHPQTTGFESLNVRPEDGKMGICTSFLNDCVHFKVSGQLQIREWSQTNGMRPGTDCSSPGAWKRVVATECDGHFAYRKIILDYRLASESRGTGEWHAVLTGVNDEDLDCIHSCRSGGREQICQILQCWDTGSKEVLPSSPLILHSSPSFLSNLKWKMGSTVSAVCDTDHGLLAWWFKSMCSVQWVALCGVLQEESPRSWSAVSLTDLNHAYSKH